MFFQLLSLNTTCFTSRHVAVCTFGSFIFTAACLLAYFGALPLGLQESVPEGAQSPHFPEPAGGTRPPTMFGALPRLSCLQLASLCGDRQGQRAVFSQLLPQSSPWGHTGGGVDSQQGSPQPRHRRLARAVIHGCPAISENQLGTGNKQ